MSHNGFPQAFYSTVAMALALSTVTGTSAQAYTGGSDVFAEFTQHIRQRVEQDKQAFLVASGCTKWFYKPTTPSGTSSPIERISRKIAALTPSEAECRRLYPGGLEAVREDFAKTQTSFSLSLTFYEFSLVADRDDDRLYSASELQDLFHALTLFYDDTHPPAMHTDALNGRFDTWYKARQMERIVEGMSRLYERGYRVTQSDRAELDRVMR